MHLVHLLLFILANSSISGSTRSQRITLSVSDSLCLPLDLFVSPSTPLNLLYFGGSLGEAAKPLIDFKGAEIEGEGLQDMKSAIGEEALSASKRNLLGVMVKEGDMTGVFISTFAAPKRLKALKRFAIAGQGVHCQAFSLSETHLWALCSQADSGKLMMISKDHKEDTVPTSQDFSFESAFKIEEEKIVLDHYDAFGSQMFAFHFEDSKNPAVKNKFFLTDLHERSLNTLEEDVSIVKIATVSSNKGKKEAVLLIHVNTSKGSELRHVKVFNFKIVEKNELKVICTGLSRFHSIKNGVFIVFEDEAGVRAKYILLHDLSTTNFELEGHVKVLDLIASENFIQLETLDSKGNRQSLAFDVVNKKYFARPSAASSALRALIQLDPEGASLEISRESAKAFTLTPTKDVCLDFSGMKEESRVQEETFEIKFAGSMIYTYEVEFVKFGQVFNHAGAARSLDAQNRNEAEYFFLDVRGNNLDFKTEDKVLHFNKLQAVDFAGDDCPLAKASFSRGRLVKLCADGRLFLFPEIDFDFQDLTLLAKDGFEIKTDISSGSVKFAKIFYDDYILIYTENRVITYVRLVTRGTSKIMTNDILVSFSDCHLSGFFFVCSRESSPEISFVKIFLNKEGLAFRVEYELMIPGAFVDTVAISPFDDNELHYLSWTESLPGFAFNRRNLATHASSQLPLKRDARVQRGDELAIAQLYVDEFVVLDRSSNSFSLTGFIGGSKVKYPLESEDFNELIDFAYDQSLKVFAFIYTTTKGATKLYVGRSTLDATQRVLRDSPLEIQAEKLILSLDLKSNHQLFFYVIDPENPKNYEIYVFFAAGPVYVLEPRNGVNFFNTAVNGESISIAVPNGDYAEQRKPSLTLPEIDVKDSKDDVVHFNLEADPSFFAKGDIYSVELEGAELDSSSAGLSLHQRAELADSKVLLSTSQPIPQLFCTLNARRSGFSLFYKDSLYRSNEAVNNMDYKFCRQIEADAESPEFEDIFICKEKFSPAWIATNFATISIELGPVDIEKTRSKLIQRGSEVYIAAAIFGHQALHLWKVYCDQKNWKCAQEMEKTIYYDELHSETRYINFFTMLISETKLVFLMVQNSGTGIKVRTLDRADNVFNVESQTLTFLPQGHLIYNLRCEAQEKAIGCIVQTDDYAFDVLIDQESLELSVQGRYLLTQNFVNFKNAPLAFTKSFFFILTKNHGSHEVLVYKRLVDKPDEIGYVYASIFARPNESFGSIAAVEDPEAKFFVTVFETGSAKDTKNKLRVDSYSVGGLKLSINFREFVGYKKVVVLAAKDSSDHIVRSFLTVTVRSNFKTYLMMIILGVLLLIFFVLVYVIVIMTRKNKELQEELDRRKLDETGFLERTYMQV